MRTPSDPRGPGTADTLFDPDPSPDGAGARTDTTTGTAGDVSTGPDAGPACGFGSRVADPVSGWDRVSVIEALTRAAQREREAKVDQLVLIARAAEVWSWIDNIDEVIDQIHTADALTDPDRRAAVQDAAEAEDHDLVTALLSPPAPGPGTGPATSGSGRGPGAVFGERLWRYGAEGTPEASVFLRLEIGPALGLAEPSRVLCRCYVGLTTGWWPA